MCGRAGRNGCESRAHLIYSSKQKKFDDEKLCSYCVSIENCLRIHILHAICEHVDSHSKSVPASTCCLVCSGGDVPAERLNILKVGKAKPVKRKRPSIRNVSASMKDKIKEALRKERSEYMMKNCPHIPMIGIHQGVCSDEIIDDICSKAQSITTVEDIDYFLLCPELQSRFFDVVIDIVRDAPRAKQRRRI